MRILTRYLVRAHAGPFLFALSMLTGLLLVNTVARRFQDLAGKGLELGVMLEVFALSVPHIVALTLPMAVLVAVLFAFSQLAAENEITALKGSGVNLARLLVPLVLAGVMLALGMVWFNDRVLPETNHRLRTLLTDIGRKSPTLVLKEQVVTPIGTENLMTRYYMRAAEIDPGTNRLKDVIIYDMSQPGASRTVYAQAGRMAFNREQTDLFLTLNDGYVVTVRDAAPTDFQRLDFERQLVRVVGVGDSLERSDEQGAFRGDREMSISMLKETVDERQAEIDSLQVRAALLAGRALEGALEGRPRPSSGVPQPPVVIQQPGFQQPPPPVTGVPAGPEDIATQGISTELRMLQTEENLLREQLNKFLVEYHKKFSIPFACIVFVLIGAPLAVRFPRGGVGMVIAVSLAIFTVYYVGLRFGEELGDKGIVPPFWAMWLTNVVALVLGLWGLTRIGKEVSTARGGGWEDLWNSIRGLVARPFTRRAA